MLLTEMNPVDIAKKPRVQAEFLELMRSVAFDLCGWHKLPMGWSSRRQVSQVTHLASTSATLKTCLTSCLPLLARTDNCLFAIFFVVRFFRPAIGALGPSWLYGFQWNESLFDHISFTCFVVFLIFGLPRGRLGHRHRFQFCMDQNGPPLWSARGATWIASFWWRISTTALDQHDLRGFTMGDEETNLYFNLTCSRPKSSVDDLDTIFLSVVSCKIPGALNPMWLPSLLPSFFAACLRTYPRWSANASLKTPSRSQCLCIRYPWGFWICNLIQVNVVHVYQHWWENFETGFLNGGVFQTRRLLPFDACF